MYVTSLISPRLAWAPVMNTLRDVLTEVGLNEIPRENVASMARLPASECIYVLANAGSMRRLREVMANCSCEVAMFYWDAWPGVLNDLGTILRESNCSRVMVTIRAAVAPLTSLVAGTCKVEYVPEAIDTREFESRTPLVERPIHVMEFGRRHDSWHNSVTVALADGNYTHVYSVESEERRLGLDHHDLFTTRQEFIEALGQTAISVCFPASWTHGDGRSAGVETLTARYLESFASSCLILGHAPAELVDLFGYNPVLEVDISSAAEQLHQVLASLADHQALVDRNLEAVRTMGDWSGRLPVILGSS